MGVIMNVGLMSSFLSDINIKRHLDHLREEKLRYSILEKSFPILIDKTPREILRLNIEHRVKQEAFSLACYIKSHECFFNSFNNEIRGNYNCSLTVEKMFYNMYCDAISREGCFLFVYVDKNGIPKWSFSKEGNGEFVLFQPILSIDLYEHTYFLDYGFDKKRFIRTAISYLDISSLDNLIKKGYN